MQTGAMIQSCHWDRLKENADQTVARSVPERTQPPSLALESRTENQEQSLMQQHAFN